MKKLALSLLLIALCLPLHSFFPFFYGARSLALGYSSLAFNYDANALFLNPSLLASFTSGIGGYQYQNSYLDFFGLSGRLQEIRAHDLSMFAELEEGERDSLLADLRDVFSSRAALIGFQLSNPAYAGRGYAFSIARVDAAVVQPLASSILDKPAGEINNADIASLSLRFLGCHYTDYALAMAFPVSKTAAVGATVHFLKGRNADFSAGLAAAGPFAEGAEARDLLQYAWQAADHDFSKFNLDFGVSASLGPYFRAGLAVKNAASPVISTIAGELKLTRRLVAGVAFRPDGQLAVTLDIDTVRGDMFLTGEESQPVSLGVEKGFFRNKLFLRAGLWSDLAAKYFLGRHSQALFGAGFGFNLGRFLVDLAMGIDGMGRIKNLAVSGFYMIQ